MMKVIITDEKEKHQEVNEGYSEFALFFDFAEFCFGGQHVKALIKREVKENVVNNVINNNVSKPETQSVTTVPHKQTYEEYYKERKLAEGSHWYGF